MSIENLRSLLALEQSKLRSKLYTEAEKYIFNIKCGEIKRELRNATKQRDKEQRALRSNT